MSRLSRSLFVTNTTGMSSGNNLDNGIKAQLRNEIFIVAKQKNSTIPGWSRWRTTIAENKNVPVALVAKISEALLVLKDDTSIEAAAVKESLGIQGYIKTTLKDFEHTLSLLKRTDVTKRFDVKL